MTAEDIKKKIIDWMEKNGVSNAAVARAIGYTAPAFSRYLSGNYGARTTHIENALLGFLKKHEGLVQEKDIAFRETATARKVWGCIQYAIDEREIVAAIGAAGTGKTKAAIHFKTTAENLKKKDHIEVIILTASASMKAAAMVRVLAAEIGIFKRLSTHLLMEEIAKDLMRRNCVIVVDEADLLNLQAIEDLRWLHDNTEKPLVLLGNDQLMQRIRGARSTDEFERISSRIAYVEILPGLTAREARELIVEYLGEQKEIVIKKMLAISQTRAGVINFRRVVKLIPLLRAAMEMSGKDEIEESMIEETARQLAA